MVLYGFYLKIVLLEIEASMMISDTWISYLDAPVDMATELGHVSSMNLGLS
jgi:hypothetical protein